MAVNDYEPGSMVITHVQGGGRDIIQYIPARSSYGTPPFVPPGPSPYVGTGMQEYRKQEVRLIGPIQNSRKT